MSFYSIFAAVLATLLFVFSASQLGLASYILYYSSNHAQLGRQTFAWGVTNSTVQYSFYWLPVVALTRSYVLQVATGVVGIVIALATLVLSFRSKPYSVVVSGKRAPRNIAWPGVSIGLSILFFLLAFPTIVITFFDDAHFGRASIPASNICLFAHGQYSNSPSGCGSSVDLYWPFTIEAWTCKMSDQWMTYRLRLGNQAADPLHRACQIGTLSRWWTVPLVILPLSIIIVALFEIRRQNIERFEHQQQQGSYVYPKEPSFSSAETASSTSPVSAISTLPQYSLKSQLHNKSKVEAEMGGKQVLEAPDKIAYDELPAQQHQVYSELSANRSNVVLGKS